MFFRFIEKKKLSIRAKITDVAESNITLNDGLKINVNLGQLIEKSTFTLNQKTGIKLSHPLLTTTYFFDFTIENQI
jgi:hypothetical protein